MGIKSFTQVFEPRSEFNYKDFNRKNVVIDASIEIYRCALGMKLSKALTDSYGNPTIHINSILLGVILKLKANGANQYWVFDYNSKDKKEDFHNPLKQLELQKRREKRIKANEKIAKLKKSLFKSDEDLFSESDNDEDDIEKAFRKQLTIDAQNDIDKQEKVAFVMKRFYTEDVIFMLNMLDIPWIECPPGYDAEQIAAFSTNNKDIFGVKMDYVLTSDADALMFGAKKLIKKDIRKKKLFEYDLNEILKTYKLSQDDFIKIGLILGTDFAKKSPGIGPKTVLKKFKDIVLAEDQLAAMNNNFKRVLSDTELKNIIVNNYNMKSFTDKKKYVLLLDWIELVKNFKRSRIAGIFTKNKQFLDNE
jgi:hypothetical protein